MVTTDTLEGLINNLYRFHYDAPNDVLYLRISSQRQTPDLNRPCAMMRHQARRGRAQGALATEAPPRIRPYTGSIAHCYLGEETDDGLILLRDEQTNHPIGLTVINWWKRFGQGAFPDSLSEIPTPNRTLGPKTRRLTAPHIVQRFLLNFHTFIWTGR